MADWVAPNGGAPDTGSLSFAALIQTLQANGLQMSAIFNTLNTNLKNIGLIQFVPVPATSASAGAPNQVAVDAAHFYWYAGSQWLRVAGATF